MADEQARWREWLEQHGAALVLFARQWSASIADAEDAVQDGFIRFWKTRRRARDPQAYLYACVRSAAMDLVRGQSRRERREQRCGININEQSMFESPAERRERHLAIELALSQLPGDQREVVVMRIWGGLSFGQIAEALGIGLNTAASRYRYALIRLEKDLAKEVTRD